jgi:UTP--glucose-1-phosphate uridylyltransferase
VRLVLTWVCVSSSASVNNKVTDDGKAVIQLETAVGAAIKHFRNAKGINVPRSRFLPVKSSSDLLLITSDLYSLEHGALVMNPSRIFQTTPVVKLGGALPLTFLFSLFPLAELTCLCFDRVLADTFKKVANFQKRFKTIPNILEADHITINGDVWFGKNVTLRGTVIIVANEGNKITIPDGSILENKLISGNLSILDH